MTPCVVTKNDEFNKDINLIISEILKRFANQKNMETIKYDKKSLRRADYFYTKPQIFHANTKITQRFESISKKVGNQRFVKKYFNILKIVTQVLQDRGEVYPSDYLSKKFDHICEIIAFHPARNLIMKNLIELDLVFVLELYKELPLDRLVQELNVRYG